MKQLNRGRGENEGQEEKDPEKPRFLERERTGTLFLRPDDKGPRDTHALGKGGLRPEDWGPSEGHIFLRNWGTGAKKNFSLVKNPILYSKISFFFYSRGQKKNYPPSPNSSSSPSIPAILPFKNFMLFTQNIFHSPGRGGLEGWGGNR